MASERTAACRLGVKSGGVIFTVTTPLAARSIHENIATAVGSKTHDRGGGEQPRLSTSISSGAAVIR
jgi:hypothetical protein